MSALPLSRARHVAWTALLWSGAVLYPVVVYVALRSGRQGYAGLEILLPVLLTVLVAVLLTRHPLPAHAILLFTWTVGLLEMQNGAIAGLQILLTDLAVCYIAATRSQRVSSAWPP